MERFSNLFTDATIRWFQNTLGQPTQVQKEAWPTIAAGKHTLVSAPTGTGKTLTAFLVYIDQLKQMADAGTLQQELYLIYVSPLKSLAGDIRENLRRPLNGIAPLEIQVGIRTGDTTQQERRKMCKTPPHILLTTPESLYLLLTSISGQKILKSARAIVIDELHAIIDTKRGAHLMLSIARLDQLCGSPLQRIGLSATIEPLSLASKYLSPEQVVVIAPPMEKEVKLYITSPLSDTSIILSGTIWTELAREVYEHCKGCRSVIAFVEGRMYAEKLAYYVNQIAGEGFARTHHGSLSKEQRFEVEKELREGKLRLLCATSSMELGIDVGDVDQVFQIGCPRTISSTMQRLGRAGHNPGRLSVMHIFPKTSSEGLYCGLTAQLVREGRIEPCHPPKKCLDILAQHLVSMATGEGYEVAEVVPILKRAYPFEGVTIEEVKAVLAMLAGDHEHLRDIPVRPRILYDRIHGRVEGDAYSRMLAISGAGTIPDKGLYAVKTEENIKLGELDEEFVYEARIGDKFLLGTFAWKIKKIQKDAVIVTQTSMSGAQLPFWKGDIRGRGLQTGLHFGRMFRQLNQAAGEEALEEKLLELGLDERAMRSAKDLIQRQVEHTDILADDRTIVVEQFKDEAGMPQMMVHSIFGRQINAPLALLLQEAATRVMNVKINYVEDDDGILLFPFGEYELPFGLLQRIQPSQVKEVLEAMLPTTPLFNITFRYNIGHALMMGVKKSGRQPLWIQRMRSAQMLDSIIAVKNHPILKETKRECLEDLWDLNGVEQILNQVQSGDIQVYELETLYPSPLSLTLRRQTEASMMYDYAPTPLGVHIASKEEVNEIAMMNPSMDQLEQVTKRTNLPEDEKQLHSLLMMEGDLLAGELEIPIQWLEDLASQGRVLYIEPGLWIAAEQEEEYKKALKDCEEITCQRLIRRALRYRGAQEVEELSARYFWSMEWTEKQLRTLCEEQSIISYKGVYYHARLFEQAQRQTIKSRRVLNRTFPAANYAALLLAKQSVTASPKVQVETALRKLCEIKLDAPLVESVILPGRVKNYRPELLDTVLAEGNIFWKLSEQGSLFFHRYEDIDWGAEEDVSLEHLTEKQRILYEALRKRGATFMQGLAKLIPDATPQDTLLELAHMGLVNADSFLPVRQWLNREKHRKAPLKQRVNARVQALNTGRWEVVHPIKPYTVEERLHQLFDQFSILSRETTMYITWQQALEVLRVWEYTGQVRRGYFIDGLSGIQFIREKEFSGTMLSLEHPMEEMVWKVAVDPMQPWGKYIKHQEGRSFMSLPGNYVALYMGMPVAVLERQGKVLRCFDEQYGKLALQSFVEGFRQKSLYPSTKRIVVKEYPESMQQVLQEVGFMKEITDYVLYR